MYGLYGAPRERKTPARHNHVRVVSHTPSPWPYFVGLFRGESVGCVIQTENVKDIRGKEEREKHSDESGEGHRPSGPNQAQSECFKY